MYGRLRTLLSRRRLKREGLHKKEKLKAGRAAGIPAKPKKPEHLVKSAKQRRDKRAIERGEQPSDGEDPGRDRRRRRVPLTAVEEEARCLERNKKAREGRAAMDSKLKKARNRKYDTAAVAKQKAWSPARKKANSKKEAAKMRRLRAKWKEEGNKGKAAKDEHSRQRRGRGWGRWRQRRGVQQR